MFQRNTESYIDDSEINIFLSPYNLVDKVVRSVGFYCVLLHNYAKILGVTWYSQRSILTLTGFVNDLNCTHTQFDALNIRDFSVKSRKVFCYLVNVMNVSYFLWQGNL